VTSPVTLDSFVLFLEAFVNKLFVTRSVETGLTNDR